MSDNSKIIVDNRDKFSDRAIFYDKARPSYPTEVIDFIVNAFYENKSDIEGAGIAADIGSGTGIMTKLLLDRGISVYAVEPNADMRGAAERNLSVYQNYTSASGSAENTTLASNSVKVIVAAQAFHWFDKGAFKTECKRILRCDGRIFLIWNRKDTKQPLISDLREVYMKYCPSFVGHSGGELQEVESEVYEFFAGNILKKVFDNNLFYDRENFVSMQLSQSYAPRKSDKYFDEFIAAVTKCFEKYQNNGVVTIINNTYVYCNEKEF